MTVPVRTLQAARPFFSQRNIMSKEPALFRMNPVGMAAPHHSKIIAPPATLLGRRAGWRFGR